MLSVEEKRERRREYRNRRRQKGYELKYRYGTTLEVWEMLFAAQGGACASCSAPVHGGKDWHTDHDHVTGKVRGILCRGCNISIGHAGDDPVRLRQMADYLEKQAVA